MIYKTPITNDHIQLGTPEDSNWCPLTWALADHPSLYSPYVDTYRVLVKTEDQKNGEEYTELQTSESIQTFIKQYDKSVKVEPGILIIDTEKKTINYERKQ